MKTAHKINKEGKIKINLKVHTHTYTHKINLKAHTLTHTHTHTQNQKKNRPIKKKINSHKTKASKGEKVKNKYINK